MPSPLAQAVHLTYRCLRRRPHRSHLRLLDPGSRCPGITRVADAAERRIATESRRVARRAARRRRLASRRGRG